MIILFFKFQPIYPLKVPPTIMIILIFPEPAESTLKVY